jgi:hypothetical protein
MRLSGISAGFLLVLCFGGCIKAPDVVIVDRKTALEQQAAGSFRGLEEDLEQAGLLPRPTPVTAAELEASGVRVRPDVDEVGGQPDAIAADTLLISRCIGEARDGTLVLTIDRCTGAIDVPDVNRLLERINRSRRQLWVWMAQRQKKPEAQVQATWREVHVAGLVCGGQLQTAAGGWETKKC